MLCSSFLLISLHPDIPKIRKQTPLCLGMQSHECLRPAQFSSAVKRLNSTFCDTVSPLRVRSVSAGHSGSIEVRPEICTDLPIYSQVAYELQYGCDTPAQLRKTGHFLSTQMVSVIHQCEGPQSVLLGVVWGFG